MAKYANLTDILDSSINVLEEDLIQADNLIDNYLRKLGINPSDISLPNAYLKDVAVKYASYVASTREAMGDNTIYLEKAKQYEKQYKDLLENLSLSTIGYSQTTVLGTVKVGRG